MKLHIQGMIHYTYVFKNITCDEAIFSVLFIMEINGNENSSPLFF